MPTASFEYGSSLGKRVTRGLVVALALTLSSSLVIFAGLTAWGEPAAGAVEAVGASHVVELAGPVHEDSWLPMLTAYQLKERDPAADMYRVFFVDHIKFQYPPASLLVLDLLPRAVTAVFEPANDETPSLLVEAFMTWPSRIACILEVLFSALILEVSLTQLQPSQAVNGRLLRVCVAVALGATFYPLWKGYELGQIQIFLNSAVALALLLQLLGRPAWAGGVLAVCCLIKPQYGVCLLFAALSRQWRFALGFACTALVGLVTSVARFGLRDHLRYLEVLQAISRRGETYWPNQSFNGLLNRLLGNGDPVNFSDNDFAPYLWGVHLASVVTALALLGLALLRTRARTATPSPRYDDALATSIVVASATMASPVAWEHHYGSFLAIFALALPGLLLTRPFGRWTAPCLGLSYLAVSNALLRPELVFQSRWLGILGSHLFFGSLLLFALLFSARRRSVGPLPLGLFRVARDGAVEARNSAHERRVEAP